MRATETIFAMSIGVFGTAVFPCGSPAANALPELDPQEITREVGFESTHNSSVDRKNSQIYKLLREGTDYFNHKQYEKALNIAREVKKIDRNSSADDLEVKCLAHVARPVEAIAMLKKSDWRTKVYVYETLGMHQEALNSCGNDPMDTDSVLFKSEMLLKDGKRSEALRVARDSYFYWISIGKVPPQAVKFFADHNIATPAPEIDEKLQSGLISLLSKLADMPKPPLGREAAALQKLFGRKFAINGRDVRGVYYASRRMPDEPAVEMRFGRSDRAPTGNAESVSITTNYASSILKPDDVANMFERFGKAKVSHPFPGLGSSGDEQLPIEDMEFALPDAVLTFQFIGDEKHLARASKSWNLPPLKKKAEGKPFIEPTVADVQRDLDKAHYKQAAQDMIAICMLSKETVENAEKLRPLLSHCYELLGKPEVADYLKVAPWRHIIHSIISAQEDATKLDTTLFQYNHRPWKIRGPYIKDQGAYTVFIPGSDGFDTYSADADSLSRLIEIVGPMQDSAEKEIAPLPAMLVDRIQLHHETASSK